MTTRRTKLLVGLGGLVLTYPLFTTVLHPQYRRLVPMEDRTVILTGATGNLGTAIAFHLARRKVRVIMACRDIEKCKSMRRELVMATGHKGLICRHLDLEDIDSINRFADEMIATEPHIDILINNAAVKSVTNKEMTKYGLEKNYFVNFLAPFLLTFRLFDKLKESAASTLDSRIINVIGTPKKSWEVNLEDINFDKRKYDPKVAYNQSKLALAYFTILLEKFNRENKNHIYVYGTSPCTNYVVKSLYRPIGIWESLKHFVICYYSQSPDRVTGSVVRCAIDPSFIEDGKSGRLYTYFLSSWGWGKAGKDEIKAKLVWNSAARALLNLPDEPKKSSKGSEEVAETSTSGVDKLKKDKIETVK